MTKQPNPDDVAIGGRVRARRMSLSMSQEKLGEALGITFQQIQKYEKGTNRIGGSRLVAVAAALQCTVADLAGETAAGAALAGAAGLDATGLAIAREAAELDPVSQRAIRQIIGSIRAARAEARTSAGAR